MKTKVRKISSVPHANGITGYDFQNRTTFETLDLGRKGIAVRLQSVKGSQRYMVVTETPDHMSAYEIALQYAPIHIQ